MYVYIYIYIYVWSFVSDGIKCSKNFKTRSRKTSNYDFYTTNTCTRLVFYKILILVAHVVKHMCFRQRLGFNIFERLWHIHLYHQMCICWNSYLPYLSSFLHILGLNVGRVSVAISNRKWRACTVECSRGVNVQSMWALGKWRLKMR